MDTPLPKSNGVTVRLALLTLLLAGASPAASEDVIAPDPGQAPQHVVESPRRIPLEWMTAGFVAVQFAAVATHDDDKDWTDEGHEFEDGLSEAPVWDDDSFLFNGILHPWVGSEYYLAARNRNWSIWGSLAYSAALSTFYEYVAENMIQQPSANDLLITPLAGSLLGEARFALKRKIRKDPASVPGARFWITLLDPVDVSIGGYPDGQARLYLNWKHAF